MGSVFSFGSSQDMVIEEEDHKPCEFQVFRHYADKIIDELKMENLKLKHEMAVLVKQNALMKRRIKKLT